MNKILNFYIHSRGYFVAKFCSLLFIVIILCAFCAVIPPVISNNGDFTFIIEEVGKNTVTQGFSKPKYVDVEGQFAVMNWHANPGALFLYNVSDPKNPKYVGHVSVYNGPNAVRIRNGYAYAALNTGNLIIASLSNAGISTVSSKNFFGGYRQMFNIDVNDEGTVIAMAGSQGEGLVLVNTADKVSPSLLSITRFSAGGVDIEGKYAFITKYDTSELRCYDISNPSVPVLISSIKVGSMVVPVRVYGNYAYVQEYSLNRMHIVDVSNPNNMNIILSNFEIPGVVPNGGGTVVDTKGDLMFLATGLNGNGKISIYDINNIGSPKMISQYVYPKNEAINMIAINDTNIFVPNFTDKSLSVLSRPIVAPSIEKTLPMREIMSIINYPGRPVGSFIRDED